MTSLRIRPFPRFSGSQLHSHPHNDYKPFIVSLSLIPLSPDHSTNKTFFALCHVQNPRHVRCQRPPRKFHHQPRPSRPRIILPIHNPRHHPRHHNCNLCRPRQARRRSIGRYHQRLFPNQSIARRPHRLRNDKPIFQSLRSLRSLWPRHRNRDYKGIADAAVAQGCQYIIFSTLPAVSKISSGKHTTMTPFDAKAVVEKSIRSLPIKSSILQSREFHGELPKPGISCAIASCGV